MICPEGHGKMEKIEISTNQEEYECRTCGVKLVLDTKTGEFKQKAIGIAAVGAAIIGLGSYLFSKDSDFDIDI